MCVYPDGGGREERRPALRDTENSGASDPEKKGALRHWPVVPSMPRHETAEWCRCTRRARVYTTTYPCAKSGLVVFSIITKEVAKSRAGWIRRPRSSRACYVFSITYRLVPFRPRHVTRVSDTDGKHGKQ